MKKNKFLLLFIYLYLVILSFSNSLFAEEAEHSIDNSSSKLFVPAQKDTSPILMISNPIPVPNKSLHLLREKKHDKIDTDKVKNLIKPFDITSVMQREADRFCQNIEDQAQNARFTLQIEKLNTLRGEVDERIKILEEKRQEYERWLTKRSDFLEKTQTALVSIVTKMKPDVAAAQLALIDEIAAASIILKLDTRTSSTILNNMSLDKSARLMHILISTQKLPEKDSN